MRAIFLVPAFMAIVGCSVDSDAGDVKLSGQNGARSYNVANFDEISAYGPDTVIVKVGGPFSVKAEGDTALLDRLEVEVKGSDLRIGRKRTGGVQIGGNNGAVTFTVTLPAIKAASLAGSGDMQIDSVAAAKFEAKMAGSGNLAIDAIKADDLDVSIAGSGGVKLAKGSIGHQEYSIAGSGSVEAMGVASKTVDISIAGSGDLKLAASEKANVSIMGSGDVDIVGTTQCSVRKMGSGDVRCTPAAAGPAAN